MIRFKNFNATGVAPDGRLYAGDLNQQQDLVAALADFTQTHDVGTLRVGDTSIQLLKYGTAEARVTAALRADGVLRGLGGVLAGTFTTAQRNAIAAGSRPYGLEILNTDTNRYEYNAGTDAVPNWQPVHSPSGLKDADISAIAAIAVSKLAAGANGQYLSVVAGVPTWQAIPPGVETGSIIPWPGPAGTEPAGYGFCDGGEISQTTYATLYSRLGGAASVWNTFGGLAAPAAGQFRKPDLRGLFLLGKKDMGTGPVIPGTQRVLRAAAATLGSLLGAEYHALLTTEMPSHDHGGITGAQSADHTHTGTTGIESVDHTHIVASHSHGGGVHNHGITDPGHSHGVPYSNFGASAPYPYHPDRGSSTQGNDGSTSNATGVSVNNSGTIISAEAPGTGGRSVSHTHTVTTGGASVGHTHAVTAQGGGGVHENTPPAAVLNFLIKL